jgi:hypothetical protein
MGNQQQFYDIYDRIIKITYTPMMLIILITIE